MTGKPMLGRLNADRRIHRAHGLGLPRALHGIWYMMAASSGENVAQSIEDEIARPEAFMLLDILGRPVHRAIAPE